MGMYLWLLIHARTNVNPCKQMGVLESFMVVGLRDGSVIVEIECYYKSCYTMVMFPYRQPVTRLWWKDIEYLIFVLNMTRVLIWCSFWLVLYTERVKK